MKRVLVIHVFAVPVILLLAYNTFAQEWKTATNAAYLKNLSVELDRIYKEYQTSVQTYAFERNILVREVFDHGKTVSLIRIMPSGIPEYYMTFNQLAAENVGTSKLRPGAELSLNLTGKNMVIGIWDSGSTNVEHQEFGDRVEIKDNIPFDDHGTHVAGTIGAAGVNPQARGMAFESNMFAYEFNNDNSEMADEAADGLIISNHSYGLRTGWDVATGGTGWQWFGDPSVSNVEDYRFGYYDASNSRVWDDIAFNAPYYLIVKSAGNDRTDIGDGTRPPDGPYDCLEPKSVAKNILTIGAVEHINGDYTGPDDVIMSEFSSWGPTDDGRIKPDISAIGVDVFSALSGGIDEYGTQSGTSMSAPNTTGSLALLQEYYAKLYSGNYMRSASLKGLVVHTANEAGKNPGPDYEFGWGLLAVDKAANIITRNDGDDFILDELNLAENDSVVFKVNSDGTEPLIATICWTDVPGVPAPISLNPTNLMLINDLDMRIYDESNTAYLPWVLDPENPDKGASFGDNFRDNVEKIEIANPAPGAYTIVIKHKDELRNGNQKFSLIVTTSSQELDLTEFYWIGGSGGWNDGNNWSFSSGGNIANAVPSINNPVIFDNNSFTEPVNVINLTSNANCYNINYYSTDSCAINLASFELNIDGSIYNENAKLSFSNGKLSFKGIVSKNNQILVSESAFNDINLEFKSINGSWNLENNFTAKDLVIENSSLFAKNSAFTASTINATLNDQNTVDFSGSVIEGLDIINVSAAPNVIFENSILMLSDANGNVSKSITGNGNTFHNVSIENADLSINGNNTFNKILTSGSLSLFGDNTFDSLRLSDVSSLFLNENTTQTVLRSFEAVGSVGNLIEIQSTGASNASLFSDNSNIRFCFDYLDIVNVSVSGNTSFLSGNNSNINANSTGWIQLDCDDALFPSFEVEFPCALGETRFVDTSTGFPTSWSWNFGNLQFPQENISTEQNPFHNFRFEGEYEVTFNVRNAQFNETITRTITIEDYESGLSVPSINVNGTRLTSSVIAPDYQWYLNNNPIPGATDRIYEIANPGTYNVSVADENCLFLSEATVVTSLSDLSSDINFSIYPNPTSGEFTIDIRNEYLGQVDMTVYDLLGNKVYDHYFRKNSESITEPVSLRSLPAGVYNLVLRQGGKFGNMRLIIGF
ncbi:MAG: S8 family serine peptidase [Cytophagales bacterium]|nr:S8 family serine peptidase [Cytophagales bacterium]